jgi:transposase
MSKSNDLDQTNPVIRSYGPEFKTRAVKMVTEQGLSQAEAARRLGVSSRTLCHWVRELAPNGQLTDLEIHAKLKALELENRRLRMEREILKKAATFFASESR